MPCAAPGWCLRRAGTDPATDGRYLEEISFEVANAQSAAKLNKRAEKLVARGVRRVFAILVKEEKVQEWTRESGWKERPLRGEICDRSFKKPLRIRAILNAAEADRLVAEALWEKGEPFLVKLVAKNREEVREEGLRRSIEDLCLVMGIERSARRRAQVDAMSLPELEVLRKHLVTRKNWPEAPAAEP